MNAAEAVTEYFTAEASRDIAAIVACFAPDAVLRAGKDSWDGRSQIRDRYTGMAADYPGLRVTITNSIAQDDRGAVCWEAVLIDPAGHEFPVSGVNVATVADGLITSMTSYFDPTTLTG